MKSIVLGLLITCVPVCFASSQAYPQAQTQQQIQAHNVAPAPKLAQNKPQGQTVKKTVRTVKKKHQPVVEHHHVYHHHYGQPKRVVVRRVPRHPQTRVYVEGAPRVRHYHYEYREPRVVYRPAPVQMHIGYMFGG